MDVRSEIESAVSAAARVALGEDARGADPLVVPARDPKFGDYQANLAMGLGKKLGRKPRDLADAIAAELTKAVHAGDLIASAEVAGPGFINLTLSEAALRRRAAGVRADDRLGIAVADDAHRQTVVVDYSSPNVAKEMHVGHLRSTVIGDCIARVLEATGQRVVRQNHLGDWGTQFGMLIEHLAEVSETHARTPQGEPIAIGDLNAFYQEAKRRFDADEAFANHARQRVVALQSGDPATLDMWRELVGESLKHFDATYARLGVGLTRDDIRGESAYNDRLADAVAALDQAGMLRESQGAAVVYPEGFVDREGDPMPMIVRKSDGGFLYATTDLAAIRFRLDELHADRLIYLTGVEQSQHFAMVFAAARQAGWVSDSVPLEHVGFGMVLGKDRKRFKTRSGKSVRLADLMDEAVTRARAAVTEKNPELTDAEADDVAAAVGIGAIKYADLSSDRIKDYVFDWDRMLALEGNTAPYLLNAYVRIRSIFRKGEIDPATVAAEPACHEPAERALVLLLLEYPRVVASVADSLEPHRLCNHLYELASSYHKFYEHCPVLKDGVAPDVRDARLALCDLVARTLQSGLGLLGIRTVERM
ncbi:MAG: arginine--tRNA ligase [Planctomycetota bacterium]